MTALSLRDVSVGSGTEPRLRRVTLSVEAGERLALLGPSGAGKSTLLDVLLGVVSPQSGCVDIGGRRASEAGRILIPSERRHLSVVFQELALWPHLTVGGNLRFALRCQGLPRRGEREKIERILQQVGLPRSQSCYPGELSGGEQQRVAIARALVTEPIALLLDEPLANLDVLSKRKLLSLLEQLLQERATTVVHVTHDPLEAERLSSAVVLLEAGRLTYRGPLRDLAAGHSPFGDALRDSLRGSAPRPP